MDEKRVKSKNKPEEAPFQWLFLRACRIRMCEWQYAYSIIGINVLLAMGIRIGLTTSCRHIDKTSCLIVRHFHTVYAQRKEDICFFFSQVQSFKDGSANLLRSECVDAESKGDDGFKIVNLHAVVVR